MKRFFFDTSALLKIYHREEGTDSCLNIYNSSDVIVISELARVNIHGISELSPELPGNLYHAVSEEL